MIMCSDLIVKLCTPLLKCRRMGKGVPPKWVSEEEVFFSDIGFYAWATTEPLLYCDLTFLTSPSRSDIPARDTVVNSTLLGRPTSSTLFTSDQPARGTQEPCSNSAGGRLS